MISDSSLAELARDVELASRRVQRFAPSTPILKLPMLNSLIHGQVFLKAECLQATGSFKIRGALNVMSRLREQQRTDHVVAFSSGNHGIGVAYAGRCLGIKATVVVPHDAPPAKVSRIRELGAEIVFYDRYQESREALALDLQQSLSCALVKPYDDWHTIAGQGTCALEALEQVGRDFDSAIICTGGGGLSAGMGTYLRSKHDSTQIYTAEPHGWDDHRISLLAGSRAEAPADGSDWCDGLLAPIPGELTFAINQANSATGLSAYDDAIFDAMKLVRDGLGICLEPSGAVAVASLLSHLETFWGQRVLVTLTGSNVDSDRFATAMRLARQTTQPHNQCDENHAD